MRQKYWRTQHAKLGTEIYTNISSKNQAKLIAKIELAELTAKIIKYQNVGARNNTQNISLDQNVCAHEMSAPMKCRRP